MDINRDNINSFFNEGNKICPFVEISQYDNERKRAEDTVIAKMGFVFQNEQKEKRASEQLTSNGLIKKTPIAALNLLKGHAGEKKNYASGTNNYIVKPVDFEVVAQCGKLYGRIRLFPDQLLP